MGEIINLNRERKARAKQDARQTAEENRIRHGQTKSEKNEITTEQDRQTKSLDGHVLSFDDTATEDEPTKSE